MRKKIIIATAAGALALAAGLVLLLTRWGNLRPAARYAVVYEKGSQNLFVALPEGSFPLRAKESPHQVFAGQYLYYDAVTDAGTDIYRMDLRDSNSRRGGGAAVAQGVRGEWAVSADGRYAAWIEAKGSVLQRGDAARNAVTELASGVDALYAAPGQDTLFFTKAEGELFRCNLKLNQRPERMASGAADARFFSGDAQGRPQSMVFFLQRAGEAFDLYALAQEGGAVLVAQGPAKMLFDDYQLGGNLYFLKQGAVLAGAVAIEDPQAQSDAAMKQPQQPAGGGRISGWLAGALGVNAAYQREKAAYDKKLERDTVRAAVAEALEGLPESEVPLDCYVYDGASARLLAHGVRADRIALLRPLGRPAMLYEKQRGQQGEELDLTISLDTLVASYRAGGVSAMREALYALAGGGAESMGYALAMLAPAGPSEVALGLDFGGHAGWRAAFLPGRETMLYQERDVEGGLYSLYSYELTDYGLSERKVIDLGAGDAVPVPDGVYYSKREPDAGNDALYYCALDGQAGRALRGAGAFFPAGDCLLAFAGGDTLYRVAGTQATQLDTGARLEGLHTGDTHVGYFTQWEAGAGTLRLADLGIKNAVAKTLDTGVTAIRVVK